MKAITCKDVKEQVEGIYYSCKEENMFWEPFEYHTQEQVDEYIDNDVCYWCQFLGIKYDSEV